MLLHLETISDAHEPQAYFCVLAVTICEDIYWQLYLLQQSDQLLILFKITFVW